MNFWRKPGLDVGINPPIPSSVTVTDWFSAEFGITTSLSKITQWLGQLHTTTYVQSSSSARPVIAQHGANMRPAVVFDGVNDCLRCSPLPTLHRPVAGDYPYYLHAVIHLSEQNGLIAHENDAAGPYLKHHRFNGTPSKIGHLWDGKVFHEFSSTVGVPYILEDWIMPNGDAQARCNGVLSSIWPGIPALPTSVSTATLGAFGYQDLNVEASSFGHAAMMFKLTARAKPTETECYNLRSWISRRWGFASL